MKLLGHKTKSPTPPPEPMSTPEAASVPSNHLPRQPRDLAAIQGRLAYMFLAGVTLAIAAMTYTGLFGFARDVLDLPWQLAWIVPISLDGAALACAFMALRSMLRRDASFGARVMLWGFTAASAGFNYWHEATPGPDGQANEAAAIFFGGMSFASVLMFDLVLRQIRRDTLRDQGAIEDPLPRFRVARWLFAWPETFQATRWAVTEGLATPGDAVMVARAHRAWKDQQRKGEPRPRFEPPNPRSPIANPLPLAVEEPHFTLTFTAAEQAAPAAALERQPVPAIEAEQQATEKVDGPPTPVVEPDLSVMTKAAAVRTAAAQVTPHLGATETLVPAVQEWLLERGMTVDRSYAYDVLGGRSGRKSRKKTTDTETSEPVSEEAA